MTATPPIDRYLALAIKGESPSLSFEGSSALEVQQLIDRVLYHGLAGVLFERASEQHWPERVANVIREQAIGQAMWELRHRAFVADIGTGLADAGIASVILKDTALAYDVYSKASVRTRGDTDLLIHPDDLNRARAVLRSLGLERGNDDPASPFDLQEEWHLPNDKGARQSLDLHWQVLNSPALSGALPLSDCFKEKLALPEIGVAAFAMRRPLTLIHTCLHRAMHIQSPYFVGRQTY